MQQGEVPIVLVPSELLLIQWLKEIREMLDDVEPQILVCGGGNSRWRSENLLAPWTREKPSEKPRLVLSTMQTAATDDFRARLRQGEHIFLVVGCLAKCPALAYWPQLETKARLESISDWDLFRDYESCPPSASDDELRSFLETNSIPQCALCPSRRVAFRHPSPLQRSNLQ
jgi:hypothetical protein